MIVYAKSRNNQDDEAGYRAYETFNKSSGLYGIKVKKPAILRLKSGGALEYADEIYEFLQANKDLKKNIKIIVLILFPYERYYYS